jgi:hypothetical protein
MWTILVSVLMSVAVPFVIKIAAFLGIGFVSYAGIDFVADTLRQQLDAQLLALPAASLAILKLAGVIDMINIIVSALISRAAIQFGASIRHLVFKSA